MSNALFEIKLIFIVISDTNSHSTEIIIVTGLKDSPNITLHDSNMHIIFKRGNITSDARSRRKRNAGYLHERHANLEHLNEGDHEKVKEIILQHRALCHEKEHEKVCQELIMKLKSIIQRNEEEQPTDTEVIKNKGTKRNAGKHPEEVINPNDGSKREAHSITRMREVLNKGLASVKTIDMHPANAVPHVHMRGSPQITDTCLLAKLLKQNYPHVHGKIIIVHKYNKDSKEYSLVAIFFFNCRHLRFANLGTYGATHGPTIAHEVGTYFNFLDNSVA